MTMGRFLQGHHADETLLCEVFPSWESAVGHGHSCPRGNGVTGRVFTTSARLTHFRNSVALSRGHTTRGRAISERLCTRKYYINFNKLHNRFPAKHYLLTYIHHVFVEKARHNHDHVSMCQMTLTRMQSRFSGIS